ncbi:molybdopterin oxidoreductase family protein [Sedimentitalea nanhaiensis]|uniref:Anaerobic selenocysteine-containing dehydrogenase n=1 Tax=Sedimentitalea nanhaiensis TaxID=999627 RepID=A0A1I6Z034_9RHOB|nr:molybdopterin oxidoreductase family protein [Sedimentitalea nanhaiensis]SFT56059.1 Anaerobic selenocysteine-containing dehydrogenase [Sedimentitalea nanhaiensis]
MTKHQPALDTSPKVSDEIRRTTCYMCACRCGINVHMKTGPDEEPKVAYIEGNRDHPVNKGVLCAKGSAGIMQHNAPSRLRKPLKRVGPRGSGEYREISWDEAISTAVGWLAPLHETAPHKLAFFTGRDQSQSFTSYWAQHFGTPNYAAHGGFCSVNMATAGIYTMGGAFWEFGQPDWERTKLFLLFGVAEDHDSNPIKMGLGRLKERGARVVGVNPIRTGYNAVADDWIGITPGTDGLLVLALIHCLLKAGRVDLDYLSRWTNAPGIVRPDGLLHRDTDDKLLVVDRGDGLLKPFDTKGIRPDLAATLDIDGTPCRTVFQHLSERYLSTDHAPEAVAERTGISARRIRALAAELAHAAFEESFEIDQPWTDFRGDTHATMTGRPVAMHAMRGVSAHANGFQTCRAIHLLQILLGTVEAPGGFRFKPPYPKPVEAHPTPHGQGRPGRPLDGPHLGFPRGPEDLLLHDNGTPKRIDKAFTWENPLSAHGLMHMVISNAHAGDPYRIDTLMMYMANMAWNSSMNTPGVIDMLTARNDDGGYVIPRIIYSDAYASEMVGYADLILPDTTYLERHDCISLLDRPICEADAAADAIRWPVVEPDRDVRGFQSVLVQLANRIGLPGFVESDGTAKWRDYADYMVNHERRPGIGPLMGWRGDGTATGRGAPNPDQLDRYIENGGFCIHHIPDAAQYFKPWNAAYQDWAVNLGLFDSPQPYLFSLWSEPLRRFQMAAEGHGPHQPPEHLRDSLKSTMDPLPIWYETDQTGNDGFTINALTQRPMAMYHSWGSQNAWLRQLHGRNPLYVPTELMRQHGLADGDWARVTSPHGEITVPVMEMAALNDNTVWTWNAIGKRKGTWALDDTAPEATRGFLLNHLIHELLPPRGDGLRWANSDPITGQAAWFDLKVKLQKTAAPSESQPAFPPIGSPVGDGPRELRWKVGK